MMIIIEIIDCDEVNLVSQLGQHLDQLVSREKNNG